MRHEERKGTTGRQVAAGEGEAQGRGKKAARPRVVGIALSLGSKTSLPLPLGSHVARTVLKYLSPAGVSRTEQFNVQLLRSSPQYLRVAEAEAAAAV